MQEWAANAFKTKIPGPHPKPNHLWNRDPQAYLDQENYSCNLADIKKGGSGGQEDPEEY